MNKFGASYNVFDDSLDLLETSIKILKKSVDFISVVYQQLSNFGQPAFIDVKTFLLSLVKKKLIDEIYFYEPNLQLPPTKNEVNKRNIGLDLSRKNGCTYHITVDSDEFYLPKEMAYVKQYIEKYAPYSTYCQVRTYYKDINLQISPPEEYYISLFYKIQPKLSYSHKAKAPVTIDPTRKIHTLPSKPIFKLLKSFGVAPNRMNPVKNKIFTRDEIQMHHMSYVRANIRRKLENSSALANFKHRVEELISYYENYTFPQKAYLAGNPPVYFDVIQTNYEWDKFAS